MASHVEIAARPPKRAANRRDTVAVIITCFNQERYLAEAIESAIAQTRPADEIIVVDDGSTDGSSAVARRYPVVCITQSNQGCAAARNAGLQASSAEHVVFLDADDRLLPEAVEAGLRCFERNPACAFVWGRYRFISENGTPVADGPPAREESDHFEALLRSKHVDMHATVMYRRAALAAAGGFDPSLRIVEDYDAYLKLAREHPLAMHTDFVAEYRRMSDGLSRHAVEMFRCVLKIVRRQRGHVAGHPVHRAAYRQAFRHWEEAYGWRIVQLVINDVRSGRLVEAVRTLTSLATGCPGSFARIFGKTALVKVKARAGTAPAGSAARRIGAWLHRNVREVPVGHVEFGALRRLTPVSRKHGFDRGQPIDRYYIEQFLRGCAADVRGRVLEIGDDAYTRKFGGDRVTGIDILHVHAGNPKATIIGELSHAPQIPPDTFDCVILTQTLHLIYDMQAAVRTLHRVLRRGGVVLVTFPGLSPISLDEWGDQWYWGLTRHSARRLFGDVFGPSNASVRSYGNVLSATSFLQGLAAEDLRRWELDYRDSQYDLLLAIRAVKGPEIA